jgi:beta-1,4-mannooligosaccharide/beta-1,4-mannosyl-N-acetylglucosamine phosphorylase
MLKLLTRHPHNPILSPADAPYPCSLLFNAGVAKFQGRYVMVFRNDYGPASGKAFQERQRQGVAHFDGTNLGLAFSDDGVQWSICPKPCITLEQARTLIAPLMPGKNPETEVHRFYDPRLTVLEGRLHMCFAIDTAHGLRGGVAVTDDLERWDILSASVPDNRNMVLFPEKIGGRYCGYERSVNTWGALFLRDDQAMMWMSFSPDLRHWGDSRHVLATESIPFANSKMGPGAPPIRTEKGWLTTFHAVERDESRGKNGWEDKWCKIYRAGLMLTDLEDPSRILGMCSEPLLSPEVFYETGEPGPSGECTDGFRNHVIFPGGMILEDSGEVKLYYGAADTFECLATADVQDLVAACLR